MRPVWAIMLRGAMGVLYAVTALAADLPPVVALRLTDMPSQSPRPASPLPLDLEAVAPEVPASAWLWQHGWERVWPLLVEGRPLQLTFAGPPAQRYLRVTADKTFTVWAHRLTVDPQQQPILAITWAVEQFPMGAALDLPGRNDRALAVVVSLGPKVPSNSLRPDVPRGLAFFWGETEMVGATYTCIPPRQGLTGDRLQCVYPHIKYIALRQGGAGVVQTDYVNLREVFQQQFPDYWQEHHQVPPIVGVSFEARSDRTASRAIAHLYGVSFQAAAPEELQGATGR
jgi:DUF3047 family protein